MLASDRGKLSRLLNPGRFACFGTAFLVQSKPAFAARAVTLEPRRASSLPAAPPRTPSGVATNNIARAGAEKRIVDV